jgi:hypothetical protein
VQRSHGRSAVSEGEDKRWASSFVMACRQLRNIGFRPVLNAPCTRSRPWNPRRKVRTLVVRNPVPAGPIRVGSDTACEWPYAPSLVLTLSTRSDGPPTGSAVV